MIDPKLLSRIEAELAGHGLGGAEVDNDRPWGGELIFTNDQITNFSKVFFPKLDIDVSKLSTPKLLLFAPHQRMSWQYHNFRGEVWRVVEGPVGLMTAPDDEQPPVRELPTGDMAQIDALTRHRLVGGENWGVVAELWVNSDDQHPSDEADNVRVQDDYRRT